MEEWRNLPLSADDQRTSTFVRLEMVISLLRAIRASEGKGNMCKSHGEISCCIYAAYWMGCIKAAETCSVSLTAGVCRHQRLRLAQDTFHPGSFWVFGPITLLQTAPPACVMYHTDGFQGWCEGHF